MVTVLGAVAGWMYWHFVGCDSGSCGITSVWYKSTAYGALMGWLVGDFSNDKLKEENNEKD